MSTHAAVWLEFDAPTDPPASHEAVCKTCHLIGVAVLIVSGDCPNCWGNF